jgi:hypothetical protein
MPLGILLRQESALSMAFKRLMERARIEDGIARKKDRKLGRNLCRLSFHSLRHSFDSAMANTDVPLIRPMTARRPKCQRSSCKSCDSARPRGCSQCGGDELGQPVGCHRKR